MATHDHIEKGQRIGQIGIAGASGEIRRRRGHLSGGGMDMEIIGGLLRRASSHGQGLDQVVKALGAVMGYGPEAVPDFLRRRVLAVAVDLVHQDRLPKDFVPEVLNEDYAEIGSVVWVIPPQESGRLCRLVGSTVEIPLVDGVGVWMRPDGKIRGMVRLVEGVRKLDPWFLRSKASDRELEAEGA